MTKFFRILSVTVPLLFCAGCAMNHEFFAEQFGGRKVRYMVTLHALATHAEAGTGLARNLATTDGSDLWVRRIPLISSASFKEIRPVETRIGEKLYVAVLDEHGRYLWLHSCADDRGGQIAIAVDGRFCGLMPVPTVAGFADTLVLPVAWSEAEAENIIKWAPRNYGRIRRRLR